MKRLLCHERLYVRFLSLFGLGVVLFTLAWMLSYFFPLVWLTIYAVCLGTNSFSIPLPERMVPSLAVFGRAGLYEITALASVFT